MIINRHMTAEEELVLQLKRPPLLEAVKADSIDVQRFDLAIVCVAIKHNAMFKQSGNDPMFDTVNKFVQKMYDTWAYLPEDFTAEMKKGTTNERQR